MKKYIMALDQGTTSSRCIIYDKQGNIISVGQMEFKQYYPKEGWVEHDANEIWTTQMTVAHEALLKAGLTYENIEAIGITNQRETTVVWDKETGEPICNAIVWQCRRTAEYCDKLSEDKHIIASIREKTGLLLDAYFSATKLRWILENIPNARERAEAGNLLFGTIETWLIWKMTGGKVHVTDYSNASRTMLFNIHDLVWDREILELMNIPEIMLPKPMPSSFIYGETTGNIFGGHIKISGAAGDQQAALFGQTCFKKGEGKSTYGTGNFLLTNTGNQPVISDNGLLTTIAWGIGNQPVEYALEGSVFICGAAIQWLRDELDILERARDTEEMALSVRDTGGVYVVPAFVGLGAPYWDPYARGAIFGITRGTNKNHIARATLESMALQCRDLIKAMEKDMGKAIKSLRVDGGACENNYLMQFQSDILNCAVYRPRSTETTSLGAAYLAGLATGYWEDQEDIKTNWQVDRIFEPKMNKKDRDEKIKGWNEALKRTFGWSKPE